jgi:hypothetical protein
VGAAAAAVRRSWGLTGGVPRLLQPPILHDAHRCCEVVDTLRHEGAREHAGSKQGSGQRGLVGQWVAPWWLEQHWPGRH